MGFSDTFQALSDATSEEDGKRSLSAPLPSMNRISSGLDKYGWFEDVDQTPPGVVGNDRTFHMSYDGEDDDSDSLSYHHSDNEGSNREPNGTLSLPLPLSEPPTFVLEAPLPSQHLWYTTAGTRPQQPPEERQRFEQLWTENFVTSSIQFPESVLAPSTKGEQRAERLQSLRAEFQEEVRGRGEGPFSNAVSKSFMNHWISCMTIQVPRFKVVRPLGSTSSFHAQFLIVINLGSSVPHGVWRRHSDFKELFATVSRLNETPGKYHKVFKNTILSWECVLSRQRWFRCLDKNYLALKCFLIERFMQDLLFESPSPDIINEFLGLHRPSSSSS